jgi:hypothetical protein
MTPEERLARVERQLLWYRRVGALVLALGTVVVLAGQAKKEELPDLEGKSLSLCDANGRLWASMRSEEDGTRRLVIYRSSHHVAISLWAQKDGTSLIDLHDREGGPRISLYTSKDGSPVIWLRDGELKERLCLYDGEVTIQDAEEKIIWKAPGE